MTNEELALQVQEGNPTALEELYQQNRGLLYLADGIGLTQDEETAPVVKQIFSLCAEGFGPSQIARKLREAEILTPNAMEAQRVGR